MPLKSLQKIWIPSSRTNLVNRIIRAVNVTTRSTTTQFHVLHVHQMGCRYGPGARAQSFLSFAVRRFCERSGVLIEVREPILEMVRTMNTPILPSCLPTLLAVDISSVTRSSPNQPGGAEFCPIYIQVSKTNFSVLLRCLSRGLKSSLPRSPSTSITITSDFVIVGSLDVVPLLQHRAVTPHYMSTATGVSRWHTA